MWYFGNKLRQINHADIQQPSSPLQKTQICLFKLRNLKLLSKLLKHGIAIKGFVESTMFIQLHKNTTSEKLATGKNKLHK